MPRIPTEHLRELRNEVDLVAVITSLRVPMELRGRRVRFRCPGCTSFHTALNLHVNLARCFVCERNFNPIDLVIAERGWGFLEAVQFLQDLRSSQRP